MSNGKITPLQLVIGFILAVLLLGPYLGLHLFGGPKGSARLNYGEKIPSMRERTSTPSASSKTTLVDQALEAQNPSESIGKKTSGSKPLSDLDDLLK